jgi:hypothetical protein
MPGNQRFRMGRRLSVRFPIPTTAEADGATPCPPAPAPTTDLGYDTGSNGWPHAHV